MGARIRAYQHPSRHSHLSESRLARGNGGAHWMMQQPGIAWEGEWIVDCLVLFGAALVGAMKTKGLFLSFVFSVFPSLSHWSRCSFTRALCLKRTSTHSSPPLLPFTAPVLCAVRFSLLFVFFSVYLRSLASLSFSHFLSVARGSLCTALVQVVVSRDRKSVV